MDDKHQHSHVGDERQRPTWRPPLPRWLTRTIIYGSIFVFVVMVNNSRKQLQGPCLARDTPEQWPVPTEPAVMPPAGGIQSATIFLLHGLAETTKSIEPLARRLGNASPHAKIIMPMAPRRRVSAQWGCQSPAWFDFRFFFQTNDTAIGPEGVVDEQISWSVGNVTRLVQEEIDQGTPPDRIVLIGYSQGSIISLLTGLSFPQRLAGVAVLSGFLARYDEIESIRQEHSKSLPIFVAHGDRDPVILPKWTIKSVERLRELGHNAIEYHLYEGMNHEIWPIEQADLNMWVRKVIPP